MGLAGLSENCLLAVIGPTATGKTRLAVALAQWANGEIISADSRQVYRGMDIGTGKDLAEYGSVPYHMVDIVDPEQSFDVFKFQQGFIQAFNDIKRRGKLPILAGGSGLYLSAVLADYQLTEVKPDQALRQHLQAYSHQELVEKLHKLNPKLHNTTDLLQRERLVRAIEIASAQSPTNPDMPPLSARLGFKPLILGIALERPNLRKQIFNRLQLRLQNGLIEEVEHLRNQGLGDEKLDYFGLEYRYITWFLQGRFNHNDLVQKLNSAIYNFAKKQQKWFRRMERQGIKIHWLDGSDDTFKTARSLLAGVI